MNGSSKIIVISLRDSEIPKFNKIAWFQYNIIIFYKICQVVFFI